MARLFGTDGVRGVANRDLTPEIAFNLGRAAVRALAGGDRPGIVIGRDTRVSGPMLQAALSSGICSAGGDVVRLGVVPTPAVSFVTAHLGAAAGVVISASHNPPPDNGIKFFSSDGRKLPDDVEDRIEALVADEQGPRPEGPHVGTVRDAPAEVDGYLEHVVASAEASLEGMHVVVDCGYGAASGLAASALGRLGARVEAINDEPMGERINVGCGATSPEVVAEVVRARNADAGVAFDGDADRALFADADGNVIDGDQVIAATALSLKRRNMLPADTVVVTVMANLGLRRSLEEAGITVLETQVGDRYVLEEMVRAGATLGGEQSGHVVFLDQATTGDGMLTAVRFLSLAAADGVTVAELASAMRRYPQVLENVRVDSPAAVAAGPQVVEAVLRAEQALGGSGRVLVRPSGTEPVVRVMVEAERAEDAQRLASEISAAIRAAD